MSADGGSADRAELLAVVDGDLETLEHLWSEGLIRREPPFPAEAFELARVARTLVRELDVNWEGVEIILRMREEMIAMRRQFLELIALMRREGEARGGGGRGD